MKNPEDKFAMGCDSMARNCQSAVECVRKGVWTLDDVDKWLSACIGQDKEYLTKTLEEQFGKPSK